VNQAKELVAVRAEMHLVKGQGCAADKSYA